MIDAIRASLGTLLGAALISVAFWLAPTWAQALQVCTGNGFRFNSPDGWRCTLSPEGAKAQNFPAAQFKGSYVPFGRAEIAVSTLPPHVDAYDRVRQQAARDRRSRDKVILQEPVGNGRIREDNVFRTPESLRPEDPSGEERPYHVAVLGLVKDGVSFLVWLNFWDEDHSRSEYERILGEVIDSISVTQAPSVARAHPRQQAVQTCTHDGFSFNYPADWACDAAPIGGPAIVRGFPAERYEQGFVPFGGADITVWAPGPEVDVLTRVRQEAANFQRVGESVTLQGPAADGSIRVDRIWWLGNRPPEPYHLAITGLVKGGKGFLVTLSFWDDDPQRDEYEPILAQVLDSLSVQGVSNTPTVPK